MLQTSAAISGRRNKPNATNVKKKNGIIKDTFVRRIIVLVHQKSVDLFFFKMMIIIPAHL